MSNHLHQDGLGCKGLSCRAFAERHGLSHDFVLRWCKEGKIFGARKHPLTKQWWIYPPTKLLCAPKAKRVSTSSLKGSMCLRRRAGLTMMAVADLLEVHIRTVRNWENGSCKIPYAAFRLMRMAGGYSLLGKAWEGWALWDGKLFSPTGRSFEPHELQYIGNYIAMARLFIKNRENLNPDVYASERTAARKDAITSNPLNTSIVRGDASGATAPIGASHRHEAVVITVDFGEQRKTQERRKSQGPPCCRVPMCALRRNR